MSSSSGFASLSGASRFSTTMLAVNHHIEHRGSVDKMQNVSVFVISHNFVEDPTATADMLAQFFLAN